MSADKVSEARDAVLELIPWRFTASWPTDAEVAVVDALIAAVREDEREKCEAEMAELREELWRAERSNAP